MTHGATDRPEAEQGLPPCGIALSDVLGPNLENVMKVEFTNDWCMNMANIEARAAELHDGCQMPMEQARELAKSEATPAPNMTADDLMRLIGRYVEACDDLGEGLFEKPLTTTDALHAKACGLHGQILAEVYRLHAEAGEAYRLRESERALVATLRDEMDEGLRLRELGGARPDEGITAMTERIVAENAQLRAQLATFTPLRAKGVVDADDNLDCWDTNPYEICTRHVAALNEKDPAAMWRVVQLFARDEAVPGA